MNYLNDRVYPTGMEASRKEEETDKERCPSPKGRKTLLECGCNPQDAIFELDDGHVPCNQAFVLDSVTIDTTGLCRPLTKLEFSSIVYFEAKAKSGCEKELEVELIFELVRICSCREECLQSWKYAQEFEIEHDDKLEVAISAPFTVTFCDRTCPDCCTYKMIVKGKEFEGEFEALRVQKPNLSAIAQGLCDN